MTTDYTCYACAFFAEDGYCEQRNIHRSQDQLACKEFEIA